MSEREIVNMIEAIRKPKNASQSSGGLMLAEISSISPLSLKINNSTISKNIYINPAYMVEASGGADKFDDIFDNALSPSAATAFLNEFHKKYLLAKGDTVIVIQSGASFYIAEKVVQVT